MTTLDLSPRREESGIDIRLEPMRSTNVSGTVIGPDGKPVARGAVTLTNLDRPNDSHETRTGSDGAFDVREVLPGRYNLWVRATTSPESTPLGGMQPVLVSASNIANLKIVAKKGALLTGRVSLDGVMSAAERATIRITTVGMPPEAGAPPADAKMGPDGRFQVRDVFGSRVIRLTHLPSGWELQSVRFNGEDITNKPIDFSGMGALSGIDVTVRRLKP